MLSSYNSLRTIRRSISIKAPLAKDHIHQLFLDKVREYRMRNPDGKPTDPTPEYEEELNKEFERLARHFGGGDDWKTEMTKFPKFVIPHVTIDPISLADHTPRAKDHLKGTKCEEDENPEIDGNDEKQKLPEKKEKKTESKALSKKKETETKALSAFKKKESEDKPSSSSPSSKEKEIVEKKPQEGQKK